MPVKYRLSFHNASWRAFSLRNSFRTGGGRRCALDKSFRFGFSAAEISNRGICAGVGSL